MFVAKHCLRLIFLMFAAQVIMKQIFSYDKLLLSYGTSITIVTILLWGRSNTNEREEKWVFIEIALGYLYLITVRFIPVLFSQNYLLF